MISFVKVKLPKWILTHHRRGASPDRHHGAKALVHVAVPQTDNTVQAWLQMGMYHWLLW
jgi:hypothetical protein